ncbi:MAG: hypothetical protein R2792_05945 [Saprospiraceae bacterium]
MVHQIWIQKKPRVYVCSCGLRNKPCVHSQALWQLFETNPDQFSLQETMPDWTPNGVAVQAGVASPTNTVAEKEERKALRLDRAANGLADLSQWLEDAARRGIAHSVSEDPGFFKHIAVRMADASLPGLSRQFRALDQLSTTEADWMDQVLAVLAKAHLAVVCFHQQERLHPEQLHDLESYLGIHSKKKDVLEQGSALAGRWRVLSLEEAKVESQLEQRKQWLYHESGQMALLLDYSFGQGFLPPLPMGAEYSGRLIFYPSAHPQRALIEDELHTAPVATLRPSGYTVHEDMLKAYARALSVQLWLAEFPAVLEEVTPFWDASGFYLLDGSNQKLPLRVSEHNGWQLLARSQGAPITLFGVWDGAAFKPLSFL